MRALLRHSLAPLRNPRLIVLHLVLNAVLLIAASFWLLIPETHIWQLLFAAVSASLILVLFVWLHAGTLAYAAEPVPERFRGAFSIKMGRLLWLLIGAFVLFNCMRVVSGWEGSRWQTAGYLYSKAPSWLRPTAGSSSYETTLSYLLSLLFWYLLPCIFLPLIAVRVVGGGSIRAIRTWGRWQYWFGMVITIAAGVWLTRLLLNWTPGHTLGQETVSLALRLVVAYAIATAAWLVTTGLMGYFLGPPDENDVGLLTYFLRPFLTPGTEANSIVRHLSAVLRNRRLLLLQLVGIVVLTVAGDVSFGNKTWQVVLGIAGGVLLLVAFLWLQAGTLAYAAQPEPPRFRAAFEFKVRRMAWSLLALVVLLALMLGAEGLLRTIVSKSPSSAVEDAIVFYLVPCLLLPWIMAKVGTGGRLRTGTAAVCRWPYWAGMAAIVFVSGSLSELLLSWRFGISVSTTGIIRFVPLFLANLPYVIGWLLTAGLLGYFVNSAGNTSSTDVLRKAAP
jgi:hypothetical protein